MTLINQWNPPELGSAGGVRFNDVWGYTDDQGREYAIVGSAFNIHILDITDPLNIVEIERIAGGQGTIWRDFKTFQDRIYAISDNTNEGLIIIDASQLPDTAIVTYQSEAFFSQCHNIFVDEPHGRLYVAGANTQSNGLIVLDLNNDPDNPELVTSDVLPGEYVHDLFVKDQIVYASSGFNGLYIYDYTNPDSIIMMSNIQTNGYNHSSWLTEDCRYIIYAEEVPSGVDMGIIDAVNLQQGEIELAHLFKFPLLAPTHTNVTPHNPYIIDTLLVVSYYEDGTQVFNIGDILSPTPYAHYDTHENSRYRGTNGNWGTYPFLPSGNIISTDIDNGLFILKIDDLDLASSTYVPNLESVNVNIDGNVDPCGLDQVQLSASGGYSYYKWLKDGIEFSTTATNSILVDASGVYEAEGLYGQCSIKSEPFNLIIEEPITPEIVISGTSIVATPSDGTYSWMVNGVDVNGLSGSSINPTFSGYYQAKRINEIGCAGLSDSLFFFVPKEINSRDLNGFDAHFNSNNNQLEVVIESNGLQEFDLMVYDIIGREVFRQALSIDGFQTISYANVNWNTGVYFVTLSDGTQLDTRKIFVP